MGLLHGNPLPGRVAQPEPFGHLPGLIDRAQPEAVFIERRGKLAAVVGPEQYGRMSQALEDAGDVAAFDAAMAEEGPDIPWDRVKADLGWV